MSESQPDSAIRNASPQEKDPSDRFTGDEPATGPQKSYLETLSRQSDQEVPEDLTKAGASQRIDELKND